MPPAKLRLPGLFNQMAIITAVMQHTARKQGLALDRMCTETHVTTLAGPEQAREYPSDGAFVHGLFIHGARWALQEDEAPTPVQGGASATGEAGSSVKKAARSLSFGRLFSGRKRK